MEIIENIKLICNDIFSAIQDQWKEEDNINFKNCHLKQVKKTLNAVHCANRQRLDSLRNINNNSDLYGDAKKEKIISVNQEFNISLKKFTEDANSYYKECRERGIDVSYENFSEFVIYSY
jgi:arginyl-tRNA--protein-N-Asp/Glu arginylyltransferase